MIYDSARLEKTARAEEFSAIKRAVNKHDIVIADAPNYIKGFRYQLFCEAKAAGTRSVVVHTAAREDECGRWNNARLEAWRWPTEDGHALNQAANTTTISGSKIGRDVLGDLQPESHTAVYGDRMLDDSVDTRSRTSSTGAAISDEDDEDRAQYKRQTDDTMTLKSLYISDKQAPSIDSTTSRNGILENSQQDYEQQPVPTRSLPSSVPSPKASLPYSPTSLHSLFMRYEPPSPFTRWDTPLFTIPSEDSHPPYDQIWEAIFPAPAKNTSKKALMKEKVEQERMSKEQAQIQETQNRTGSVEPQRGKKGDEVAAVKMNAATVLPQATTPNALQLFESTTGEITKLVLAAARAAGVADGQGEDVTTLSFTLPATSDTEELALEIELPESITLSQPKLQRLRRKFTQIQRGGIAHGQGHTSGRKNIAVNFASFLEEEFAAEAGNG